MAEQLRLEHFRVNAVGEDLTCLSEGNEELGSRGRFARNALLAGAGLLLGGAAGAVTGERAAGAPSPRQDRRILQFLLRLEHLQAEFYSAAEARGRLRGELREFAEVVGAHERAHVALLERRLGKSAGPKPSFDFGEATDDASLFARTARRLEELGVAAYIGQGANLTPRSVVSVSRITAAEARHAAWIADFLGRDPAPLAADKARTSTQVLAAIRRTGFLR
jgi:rubrerythrin